MLDAKRLEANEFGYESLKKIFLDSKPEYEKAVKTIEIIKLMSALTVKSAELSSSDSEYLQKFRQLDLEIDKYIRQTANENKDFYQTELLRLTPLLGRP